MAAPVQGNSELNLGHNKLKQTFYIPRSLQHLYIEDNDIEIVNITLMCPFIDPVNTNQLTYIRMDQNKLTAPISTYAFFCFPHIRIIYYGEQKGELPNCNNVTKKVFFIVLTLAVLRQITPPIQQESFNFYDYDTDFIKGKMVQQDDEMKFKDVRKNDESIPDVPPTKDTNLPTCLLCVCLSGSVYCEETDIESVPPLPKETAYLYARFNKIKKVVVSDFADIPTLKRIDFTGNMIEVIEDGTFSKLLLLEELSLAENKLVKLPVLPPKLITFNANHNRIKSRGIKANAFKKLTNLSHLYLGHNALDSVPLNLPESLCILHLQFNNITTIKDDTFCKSNNTRYVHPHMEEIRMEGNPIILGKHPNAFSCLRTLPTGAYY
ncbi:mimecan [Alligator mississippiensis]|uniref:Mimecan n=1 Tax=Alligator mississippiensis TaxID=8496 RepID=A0A151PBB6_ALLMI|nr:mimecan [Alligator mississippiensis]